VSQDAGVKRAGAMMRSRWALSTIFFVASIVPTFVYLLLVDPEEIKIIGGAIMLSISGDCM
jgi:hypothetical protein